MTADCFSPGAVVLFLRIPVSGGRIAARSIGKKREREEQNMLKKICAIACVVIGLVVIIIGASFSGESANYSVRSSATNYQASNYDLTYASFGGDFYTYIYKGSDTIVDELDDINHAMEKVISAENTIQSVIVANVDATSGVIRAINAAAKTLIIALGLGILAFGLNSVGKAFELKPAPAGPGVPPVYPEEQVPEAPVYAPVEEAAPEEPQEAPPAAE